MYEVERVSTNVSMK